MTSPGGKEVGRVSVRVVPDTSKFRRRLRQQLQDIADEVVEVGLRVNGDQAREETRRVRDQIQNSLRDLDVDINMSRFEQALARQLVRIAALVNGLRRVRTAVVDITKAFAQGTVQVVRLVGRVLNLRNHFLRVRDAIRGIPAALGRLKSLDSWWRGFIRTGDAAIRMKDRIVNAGRSMRSLAQSAVRGLASALSGLGQVAGNVVSGLASMGRTAWIVIGVFAAAAPVLGLVSGLLAGLPSLLAAAGAAAGAVALGWDGIKRAAQTLKPEFDSLKASLSQTFERGLTPVFNQLRSVFPTLKTGLNQVAQGLIPVAQGFTDAVTSAQGMQQIGDILRLTGGFLAGLAPVVKQATQSFLMLGQAGAQQFYLLNGTLARFSQAFYDMVQRVTSTNVFANAMQGLNQVLDALLQSFVRLFEVGLQTMAQLGGPLATLITGFTNAVVGMMPILTALTGMVANVLGPALTLIGQIFVALTPSITVFANMLGTLLVGAIQALTPVLTAVANIFNTVLLAALRAIEPVLPVIVNFMVQLGQTIGSFLGQALTMVMPLIQMLSQFLAQVLMAVTPLLPLIVQLAQAFLQGLLTALQPLMPLIMNLAATIFPMLLSVIQALMPVFMQVIQIVIQLIPVFANLVATIAGAVIPVMQAVLGVVQAVWPHIQSIIQAACNLIMGIIRTAMAIIQGDWSGAWEGIKQILSAAWQAISSAVQAGVTLVISFFQRLPGQILGALGNLGSLLYNAGVQIINGLWNGLKAAFRPVIDWVSRIAGWIRSVKGPLPKDRKLLVPAGKAIMEGLERGLERNFQSVLQLVSDMAQQIARPFEAPIDVRMNAAFERSMGNLPSTMTGEIRSRIESGEFGMNTDSLADAIVEGLTGSTLRVDGTGVARLVNKTNLRRERRG